MKNQISSIEIKRSHNFKSYIKYYDISIKGSFEIIKKSNSLEDKSSRVPLLVTLDLSNYKPTKISEVRIGGAKIDIEDWFYDKKSCELIYEGKWGEGISEGNRISLQFEITITSKKLDSDS